MCKLIKYEPLCSIKVYSLIFCLQIFRRCPVNVDGYWKSRSPEYPTRMFGHPIHCEAFREIM